MKAFCLVMSIVINYYVPYFQTDGHKCLEEDFSLFTTYQGRMGCDVMHYRER